MRLKVDHRRIFSREDWNALDPSRDKYSAKLSSFSVWVVGDELVGCIQCQLYLNVCVKSVTCF